MEGGNKNNINLESPLDISSSDMLVPVSQPTFQHNWQKYQGKFLPNSLRFEKNGWAAGWNVYNFDWSASKRLKFDDIYVDRLLFNSRPVYLGNVYGDETATKAAASFFVIKDNNILSNNASMTDNVITGKVGDAEFTVIWDTDTETATVTDTDRFDIIQTRNADKTWTLHVVDKFASYDIDNNLYEPSSLSGGNLAEDIAYSDYTNGQHTWQDYSFDGTAVKTPDGQNITVFSVSDINTLTFSYDLLSEVDMTLTITKEKFYFAFNNCTVKPPTGKDYLLVTNQASENAALTFNRYQGTVTPKRLEAKDPNGIIVDVKVPVWLTVAVQQNVELADEAKWPDNVKYGAVRINTTALFNKYTATSVFDNANIVTIDDNPSSANTPLELNYRYSKITTNNTIEKDSKFNTQRHLIRDGNTWCFSIKQFSNLSTSEARSRINRLLGNIYTFGDCYFNAKDYFDVNTWADWTDKNNAVYTKPDLSIFCSVKKKGAADAAIVYDDAAFVKDNFFNNEALLSEFVCNVNVPSVTAYNVSDSFKSITNLYDAFGNYIGGTFETEELILSSDASLWPFKYVPRFNYRAADGTRYTGAYYVNVSTGVVITDFSEFMKVIMGNFDGAQDPENNILVDNSKYNIHRIVKCYDTAFDFDYDYIKNDSNRSATFRSAWDKWYPSTTNPLDITRESSYDETYKDYEDIDIFENQQPTLVYTKPGVVLQDTGTSFVALDALNSYDLVPWKDMSTEVDLKIYHNHEDVTGLYKLSFRKSEKTISNDINDAIYLGNISFDDTSVQFGSNFSVIGDIAVGSYANGDSFGSKTLSIFPSSVQFVADPIDPDKCWAKQIAVGYKGKTFGKEVLWTYTETVVEIDIYGVEHIYTYIRTLLSAKTALASGVETVMSDYFVRNTEGCILAMPLYGHAVMNVTYNDVYPYNEINSSIDEAFTIKTADDSQVTKDGRIYIDRDTLPHAYNWFELTRNSLIISDMSEVDSYLGFELKAIDDDAKLFFAKAQRNGAGKEVLADYYYPTVAGVNGSMSESSDSLCTGIVKWNPEVISLPTSASLSADALPVVNHVDYENVKALLSEFDVRIHDVTEIDPVTHMIPLTLTSGPFIINVLFNTLTEAYVVMPAEAVFNNTKLKITGGASASGACILSLSIAYYFRDIIGKFAASVPDELISYTENKYVLKSGDTVYEYDLNRNKVTGSNLIVQQTDKNGYCTIKFSDTRYVDIVALLSNVVNGMITFDYEGKQYSISVDEFMLLEASLNVLSTDIRNPGKTKVIGKLNYENEYQLVKQAWNTTVEVENFWWVDDQHILELTQDKFILRRKTDELDDWNGDRFENVHEESRSNIIDSTCLRYEVTNTYNTEQRGLLLVFRASMSDTIEITVRDPRENLEVLGKIYFKVVTKQIGQKLNETTKSGNTAIINSYTVHSAVQLIMMAKWSNTITDGRLIIGCHLSNNFDQWTGVFTLSDFMCEKCIQGYGYVGLHGDLTGGMLPDKYFDKEYGFNGTVNELGSLIKDIDPYNADSSFMVNDASALNKIQATVIGTADRQWYIDKELYGIVSHLVYDKDGNFEPALLPITNKYDSCYRSPSFAARTYGDLMVQSMSLSSLFKFGGGGESAFKTITKLCGEPSLFYYNPRCASLVYLQQTIGQYAYVHYNSSESYPRRMPSADNNNKMGTGGDSGIAQDEIKAKEPVLSDDITFGKQIFYQNLSSSPSSLNQFYEIIIAVMLNELNHIDRDIAVNIETNQTATADTGKKYAQNALENLAGLGVKALLTESHQDASLTSKVVGIKSLDMFYSTSEKQSINAGPGFVEHQLVADCVAQSTTDVSTEGSTQQLSFILRMLTTLQGKITLWLQKTSAQLLRELASNIEDAEDCGISWGFGAAMGMTGSAAAIDMLLKATELSYDALEQFTETLAQRNISVATVSRISRSALTSEGKHKYGEKNETFMWPCFGIPEEGLDYNDETVNAGILTSEWKCMLKASICYISDSLIPYTSFRAEFKKGDNATLPSNCNDKTHRNVYYSLYGNVPFYQAACYGTSVKRKLPKDMACVQGVQEFLPKQTFKNENIGVSDPVFPPSLFQDYIIDKDWNLSQCCTYGMQQWVTVKDTKITNCPPSNMRITADFCGVATPYSAVEVKRGLSRDYMRPWTVTPNVLAMNCTGLNSILDDKLYHSFDGISYRLVEWSGTPAIAKNNQTYWYAFQVNDRFKRSNKFPANELLGNFASDPVSAAETLDPIWSHVTIAAEQKGMEGGTVGEDKDTIRWAIPVFTEPVTTLPAAVKTMTAMPLQVHDGITGLVTNLYNNQAAYKAPLSVDFTIGKNVYRQTEEYICSVQTQEGLDIITELVPSLGLKYIGATPTEAYFYSQATRCYYVFSGTTLVKMDIMERFRDIQRGYWDFVNQEVIMPCLMTFKRLNPEVEDKDTETDNVIVPVLSKGNVSGELPPPLTTVFNDRSWYKCVSLPSGFAYQGPNRVIINRSVFCEYMEESIKSNMGKWDKINKEKYASKRGYPEIYDKVTDDVSQGIDGWTYNPFMLVTSAYGLDEDTDCLFEWTITFCWPIEMDLLYGQDNYAVVNIMAEAMTPGGRIKSRPTHVYLTKELFTRNGNYGYYSFRFQSKNGSGNRERLHIWSDQYIAISKLDCEVKPVTSRRSEQLTQQLDVQKLKEL